MARPLAKSPFVLLALGLWICASSVSLAEDDNLKGLNQRIYKLFGEGKYREAIPLAEKAVEIARRVRGPDHPDTAISLSNLAEFYEALGEYAKAEPPLQEALRIRQKVLGHQHPDIAESLNNLAGLYEAMGEYAKAEPLYQEALQIWQKVSGSEHPDTADGLDNLGGLYKVMGEYAKAEPLLQEALRIRQKVLGSEHPDTAKSLDNLADCTRRWASTPKPNRSTRKRSGLNEMFLALIIPTRRSASVTWPSSIGIGRVRQSRAAPQGSASHPAKGFWARAPRSGSEPQQPGPTVQENGRVRQSRAALPGIAPNPAESLGL
jgi:tetratricopeptide (TPR) repeat protein